MQRQGRSPSTFRLLCDIFTCSTPQKPFTDEEQLLLNPSEPSFSDQDISSDETENNFSIFKSDKILKMNTDEEKEQPILDKQNDGAHISVELDDGFYAEVYDEFSRCDNVACCVCLLPIGLCGCAGLVLGCTPVTLLPATAVAALTPVQQAVMLVALPFGSLFGGFGAGALCWGKSTEAAERWVKKRTEQNKSLSVCGFFTSWCESAEEKPEAPFASIRMQRE